MVIHLLIQISHIEELITVYICRNFGSCISHVLQRLLESSENQEVCQIVRNTGTEGQTKEKNI